MTLIQIEENVSSNLTCFFTQTVTLQKGDEISNSPSCRTANKIYEHIGRKININKLPT